MIYCTCRAAPRKPSVEESEDGGQQPRMGFSDEECCVPKFCKNFLCTLAYNESEVQHYSGYEMYLYKCELKRVASWYKTEH